MQASHRQIARILVLAILAAVLVTFALACGGGDEPEVVLATSTPQPAEPSPTASPPPTEVPEDIGEHLDAATAYYDAGEYDKAIAELERAIELEPGHAGAYTNLALAHFAKADYESAAAAWTEVIRLEPRQAAPRYERGLSYFNLKNYEGAIDDLSQSIELDPASADAYRVRGKAYAFAEDYESAIADFSRTIELDPTSDEAYYNRAASRARLGSTPSDLAQIIADYAMVLQISENDDLRGQVQAALETFLEQSDDPVLRQQASDALQGKAGTADSSEPDTEPSLMDIDINRAPGHSIGFEHSLEPGASHRFLFLASSGDTIGAGISSGADMAVGIQDASTGQVLGAVPSNDNSLVVTIPQNALYYVVIEDTGGQGGAYTAAFEASPQVRFDLNPNFFIIGRLPEGGQLYYTFTTPGGATLQGNVIPHPDTPVDLVVRILDLQSQAVLLEVNNAGPGENEQFAFTVPDSGDGQLQTHVVSIEDADGKSGAYILSTGIDLPAAIPPPMSPESVVQAVFDAAQSGDFASVASLCDPLGENDDDTQMICDVASDEANREAFIQYFSKGAVQGEAVISPANDQAEVPFTFGPDGDREETMKLINRDGKWYLLGF